jgi:hypothetical protein
MGLLGTAIKVGPLLNGKRLVMNITNDSACDLSTPSPP